MWNWFLEGVGLTKEMHQNHLEGLWRHSGPHPQSFWFSWSQEGQEFADLARTCWCCRSVDHTLRPTDLLGHCHLWGYVGKEMTPHFGRRHVYIPGCFLEYKRTELILSTGRELSVRFLNQTRSLTSKMSSWITSSLQHLYIGECLEIRITQENTGIRYLMWISIHFVS